MVQNPALAKAISDAGWGELTRQLAYKATWYGRTFVQIDTFFPSSKTCSQCGHGVDFLPLGVRTWTCPKCGAKHDRDLNASKNILAEGLSVAACGETVRSAKTLSLGRRDSVKQEALEATPRIPRIYPWEKSNPCCTTGPDHRLSR